MTDIVPIARQFAGAARSTVPGTHVPRVYTARVELLDVGDSDLRPIRSRYFERRVLLPIEPQVGDTVTIDGDAYLVNNRRIDDCATVPTILLGTATEYSRRNVGAVIDDLGQHGFREVTLEEKSEQYILAHGLCSRTLSCALENGHVGDCDPVF